MSAFAEFSPSVLLGVADDKIAQGRAQNGAVRRFLDAANVALAKGDFALAKHYADCAERRGADATAALTRSTWLLDEVRTRV